MVRCPVVVTIGHMTDITDHGQTPALGREAKSSGMRAVLFESRAAHCPPSERGDEEASAVCTWEVLTTTPRRWPPELRLPASGTVSDTRLRSLSHPPVALRHRSPNEPRKRQAVPRAQGGSP